MIRRRPLTARLLSRVTLTACLLAGSAAVGDTHLLIMGGGSKPDSNQVSLEKNVNYFHRVIDRLGWAKAQRDILFACGDDPAQNDVQFIASASDDPQAMQLINMLVGPGKGLSKQYRPHSIGGGERASSRENISQWFDQRNEDQPEQLDADDTLLLYFTGHGGKGEKDNDQNTCLYLWPNHNLRMQEFTQELDKLDPQTPVVMVMVQCYSGGFANVIFNEGQAAKGVSDFNRCGFFAAVHSRTAAGCTAHVNEADYKEYSSYFWAALSGEDRLGQRVDRPDYDGDGQTNYLEAHAYAMIHSDSTDLSMTTTDRLVRALEVPLDDVSAGLLSQDSAYPDLYQAADSERRAILEGLSVRLNLSADDRAAQARAALENAQRERMALFSRQRAIVRSMSEPRKALTERLTERWPELSSVKGDQLLRLVIEHAGPMREAVADDAAFTELSHKLDELAEMEASREALTATIAHAERFLYTCESVALIDTLLRHGKAEQVTSYNTLLKRERSSPTPVQ